MKLNEVKLLVESVADAAVDAFNMFKRSKLMRRGSDFTAPVPAGTGRAEFSIRDWGTWENPPEAEDEEDYDWQVPTKETEQEAKAILKSCEQRFPKFKFTIHAGEKNWLYVEVQNK